MKKENFAAGAASASVICVLLQPFDVYKTRVQELRSSLASSSISIQTTSPTGGFRLLNQIVKEEGPRAFWKGTVPTLMRNVPGTSIYFGILQAIKNTFSASASIDPSQLSSKQFVGMEEATRLQSQLANNPFICLYIDEKMGGKSGGGVGGGIDKTASLKSTDKLSNTNNNNSNLVQVHYGLSNFGNLLAGGCARATVGTLFMPITVIKVRLESHQYKYTSLWHATSSIYKKHGLFGFFKGTVATAMRDAPFAGVYIVVYEKLRLLANKTLSSYNHSAFINMTCGLIAGFAATLTTQPFDLIKTRIQLRPSEYGGTLHAFSKVFREEGISGFFKGTAPRLMRKSLSSALTWVIYEELMVIFRAQRELEEQS